MEEQLEVIESMCKTLCWWKKCLPRSSRNWSVGIRVLAEFVSSWCGGWGCGVSVERSLIQNAVEEKKIGSNLSGKFWQPPFHKLKNIWWASLHSPKQECAQFIYRLYICVSYELCIFVQPSEKVSLLVIRCQNPQHRLNLQAKNICFNMYRHSHSWPATNNNRLRIQNYPILTAPTLHQICWLTELILLNSKNLSATI